MCSLEGGVVYLLLAGVLVSIGVSVPMLMITYPGGECVLFTSVRGEALIYGHLAGCNYITGAHLLVVLGSIFFFIMFLLSRRNQRPDGSVSNRSLRGSVGTFSQSSMGRAKVSMSMVMVSVLLTSFVLLTAIIIIAGYFKTCGELQYEANREIQRKTTLGLKNPYFECFSLFGDADIHNRFHFDHYELNGNWHGQYATYKHGTPQIWSGNHDHQIPIVAGLLLSIICAVISFAIWFTISILLIILRKSLKTRNRRDVAESMEDARIWASDMQAVQADANRHQYEMINKNKSQYESLHHLRPQAQDAGGVQNGQPSLNGQTVDKHGLLQHQEIIAKTHADGSFFQTPEGTYVQLVNGVLTNVDITPMMQGPVQYMELEFQQQQQQQQQLLNQELNHKLTDLQRQHQLQQQLASPQQRQQYNLAQQQSLQQQQQLHQQQLLQQQLASQEQQHFQQQFQNGRQTISANQLMAGRNQLTQPLIQHGVSPSGSVHSSQFSQAPTVSHISGSKQSSNQGTLDSNTRLEMRMQHDLAKKAGIRCSQF